MPSLATLLSLNRWEWWILLQMAIGLPLLEMALPLLGFKRLLALLKHESNYQDNPALAQEISSLFAKALPYHPFSGKCLARSLLLWRLLAAHGLKADIVLGVKKDSDFRAHAWVEYQGMALSDDGGYESIYSLEKPRH